MLELKEISKSFKGELALKGVTLKFDPGQTHVLLGSSGSGKSTLLRIILGLIDPDSGTAKIDDQVICEHNRNQFSHLIGYVPQDGGLFPHLTAQDNVTLVARTIGWNSEKIRTRLAELLSVVSVHENLMNRFPRRLSGGEKQRIAIMRAAFLDPQIMILDEPLGALDPLIRSDLQVELKNIFNRLKKTVVLVTHDVGEAAFFGHTITLMHAGQVVQKGTLQDLLHRPATPFVTQFINAQRTLHNVN